MCLCENVFVTSKCGNAEVKKKAGRTLKTENNMTELS